MSTNRDVPIAVVFCLASVAACFAMGYSVASWLFDRLRDG